MEYAIGVGLAILADLFPSWAGLGMDRFATPDDAGRALLMRAGQAGGLTARGWTRTLRLARTIADLDGCDGVLRRHIAEALVYRLSTVGAQGDFERQTGQHARTPAFQTRFTSDRRLPPRGETPPVPAIPAP